MSRVEFLRGRRLTIARRLFVALVGVIATTVAEARAPSTATGRARARELGVAPGIFRPGASNAITDVAGVRVGHATLVVGDSVRTGVTAILPHEGTRT